MYDLASEIEKLEAFQVRVVREFLMALRTDVNEVLLPDSWILAGSVARDFRSRLTVQEAYIGTQLKGEPFEMALLEALRESGRDVAPAPGGQRFWDLRLDGRALSLKSTSAQDLRQDYLHISKLTEAAWIQDCRTASDREHRTKETFRAYMEAVASILQLRFFRRKREYELVEIPCSLLGPILDLSRDEFKADGPTLEVLSDGTEPDLVVRLDRSDAKITLTRIRKDVCIVHGTWRFP